MERVNLTPRASELGQMVQGPRRSVVGFSVTGDWQPAMHSSFNNSYPLRSISEIPKFLLL